ncbi:MAG: hypothetical protein HPY80_04350 [Bacteroidales bacterium]|jgi:hypothetical protein|nr:hypothetical protein [Bacteroidales bacterium]NPV35885.1 hypothetical protein [Bacteroidales bacterium]
MNTSKNSPDDLLRMVFAAIPSEEPSPQFTQKVMERIPSDHPIMQPLQEAPFNIGFRTAIALLLTISFFGLLIFSSDFSFTEWILRFSGTLLKDFSLSSLLYLAQTAIAKIFDFKVLSIMAGIVFLVGGSLMVLYRISNDKKTLSHMSVLFII